MIFHTLYLLLLIAGENKKTAEILRLIRFFVGMTGFEPATTRPPDVYSNRAELHPESSERET